MALARIWVFSFGIACGAIGLSLVRKLLDTAKGWDMPTLKVKLKYDSSPSSRLWGVLPAPKVLTKQFRKHMEALCDDVFAKVDHDESGRLNSAELHIAVLLVYSQANHLFHLNLKPPDAEAVKVMLMAADLNDDGQLNRMEFKDVFMSRFFHRILSLAIARLLTQRLLVPAAAVALQGWLDQQGASASMEEWAARTGMRFAGALAPTDRRAAGQLASATTRRIMPLVNLQLAGASAQLLHVEGLLARLFSFGSGTLETREDS
mmetsp:Transcript_52599/g.122430  ORF Transcript_52599/g.122430 Transcript_52599/m.122430 type:complete len:262 (+) Transcript_52599:77-862(+)